MERKIIILSIAIVLVTAVVLSQGDKTLFKQANKNLKEVTVQADHRIYDSAQELKDSSEIIVVGEPVNDIAQDEAVVRYYTGEHSDPARKSVEEFYTLRTIKIHKVVKGILTEDTMKIIEMAAIVDESIGKVLMIPDDYSIAQKGKKYIFFLKKGYNTEYYFIAGVNQGKFNIDGTDEKEKVKSENHSKQFSDLKKQVLETFLKEVQ